MNKIYFLLMVLLFTGFTLACKSEYDPKEPVLGLWIPESQETISNELVVNFRRAAKFEENKTGYQFKANGLLISRQNEGWCSTPPIPYVETQGAWVKTDDKLLLKVTNWSGIDEREYIITKLTQSTLQIKEVK